MKNSTIFGILDAVFLLTHQFLNTLPYPNPFEDFEGGSKILEKVDGAIVFAEVCFSYPKRPDALVLKNVSVTVPAGCTTAFVGSSGSGKILGVEDFGDRNKDRRYEKMKNICSFPFLSIGLGCMMYHCNHYISIDRYISEEYLPAWHIMIQALYNRVLHYLINSIV